MRIYNYFAIAHTELDVSDYTASIMEGGDNPEQLAQTVIQPEISEPKETIPDDESPAATEALTDSILDDDLVVIPSLNEQIEIAEIEKTESAPEQPDTEPSVIAPSPVEPKTEEQAPAPASEPSQAPVPAPAPVSDPAPVVDPTPVVDPNPVPVSAPAPAPAPAPPPAPPSVEIPRSRSVPPPQPNPEPARSRPTTAAKAKPIKATAEDDDEDFEDETMVERLVGLSEMFPESVRNATQVTLSLSVSGLKKVFNFSKSALWIGSTSFMVLILPIVFETEMVHMEQAQIQRQKQILLGPNAATTGALTGAMTPPIPGVSVAAAPDSR